MSDQVKLKYLCNSYSTPITQGELKEEGQYPVFGASGKVGYLDNKSSNIEYLGIIKDGAGVGRVNKYPKESSLLGTMAYIIPNDNVNINWLKYAIMGLDLGKNVDSTTIPHIYFKDYGNKYVTKFNMRQQILIGNFLDTQCSKIDTILEKTRESIDEYKKLKQAVITQAVTKGIRGDRLMKDSGIEWIGEIPEEWDVVRGKNVFMEVNNRSVDGKEELLTVSQYTGITPRSQKNVTMFQAESLIDYKICEIGDIAANTMWMWDGAVGVSKYYGVISPSYNVYRQKSNQYNPCYLDYLLRIPILVQHYESMSTGIRASRLRLYPQQFLSIMFLLPSIQEQEEIVTYLDTKIMEMDKLISKKEQFLTELETYKKSLIYEYVTGKKEVPDV